MRLTVQCIVIGFVFMNIVISVIGIHVVIYPSKMNTTESTHTDLNTLIKTDTLHLENVLLAFGVASNMIIIIILFTLYTHMTKNYPNEKFGTFDEIIESALKKANANRNVFPSTFVIKKIRKTKSSTTGTLKNNSSENTSCEPLEGIQSSGSSLKYPIQSSDVSLLTAIKKECRTLYPQSSTDKTDKEVLTSKNVVFMDPESSSTTTKEHYQDIDAGTSKGIQELNLCAESLTDTANTETQQGLGTTASGSGIVGTSSGTSQSTTSKGHKKSHQKENDTEKPEFSDNFKYFWPEYVTALQDPDVLLKKNQKFIDHYNAPKLPENADNASASLRTNTCNKAEKEELRTFNSQERKKRTARYLRFDPPLNLDDPWISEDLRKKFNIPKYIPENQQNGAFKDFVSCPTYDLDRTYGHSSKYPTHRPTQRCKSTEPRRPPLDACSYDDHRDNSYTREKLAPPFSTKRQFHLPPEKTLEYSVAAENRRRRLSGLPGLDFLGYREHEKKTVRKERNEYKTVIEALGQNKSYVNNYQQPTRKPNVKKDQFCSLRFSICDKAKRKKKEEVLANTTVQITVPKSVDMSRPLSVPPTPSRISSGERDSSRHAISSNIPNEKTKVSNEFFELDFQRQTEQSEGLPPPAPRVPSDRTYQKTASSSKDYQPDLNEVNYMAENSTCQGMFKTDESPDITTPTETTFLLPAECSRTPERGVAQQSRAPTKQRIQQDEIRRQKLLALQKKKERYAEIRERQRARFSQQKEINKPNCKQEMTRDTFPLDQKGHLEDGIREMDRQELKRRLNDGILSDSLTSGSYKDACSPYRIRYLDKDFVESVWPDKDFHPLGKSPQKRITNETISSGSQSLRQSSAVSARIKDGPISGPIFIKDEKLTKSQMPHYVFYESSEKASLPIDRHFYSMQIKQKKPTRLG